MSILQGAVRFADFSYSARSPAPRKSRRRAGPFGETSGLGRCRCHSCSTKRVERLAPCIDGAPALAFARRQPCSCLSCPRPGRGRSTPPRARDRHNTREDRGNASQGSRRNVCQCSAGPARSQREAGPAGRAEADIARGTYTKLPRRAPGRHFRGPPATPQVAGLEFTRRC